MPSGALKRSTRLPTTLPQDNTTANHTQLSTTFPTNPALALVGSVENHVIAGHDDYTDLCWNAMPPILERG
jgi:hypothetical protein